jgi:hypothetical protein
LPRFRIAGLVVSAWVLGLAPAGAGPHAYGVLLTHLNPDIEYTTSTTTYAGQSDLDDCDQAVTEGPIIADRAQVWFVIASFANSPGPVDLGGATFGFANFSSRDISFGGYGACNDGDLEIPTSRWPGPREGTSVVWTTSPRSQDLVEIYWFATYVYDVVSVELTVHPQTEEARFATPSRHIDEAPVVDDVADFGILGFGEPGYNPCATAGPASGACCIWGQCRITRRDDCESQGGIYQGDNTDCFPDPCTHDEIETTWGLLKRMYE